MFSVSYLDKGLYFGLEIFQHPLLFPNKKNVTQGRVKLFIYLVLALVKGDLMVYAQIVFLQIATRLPLDIMP